MIKGKNGNDKGRRVTNTSDRSSSIGLFKGSNMKSKKEYNPKE
jgi:hypothetical protein